MPPAARADPGIAFHGIASLDVPDGGAIVIFFCGLTGFVVSTITDRTTRRATLRHEYTFGTTPGFAPVARRRARSNVR